MALTVDGFWAFNGAWRRIQEGGFHVFDGAAWQEVTDAWAFDGAAWRKFFEVTIVPTIDSSAAEADTDADEDELTDECSCECSAAKKSRCICIHWNVSNCGISQHIQVQESSNGSTWTEEVDNRGCINSPLQNWCQGSDDGGYEMSCSTYTNRYARIRIHDDTTHSIRATGSSHGPFPATGCVGAA